MTCIGFRNHVLSSLAAITTLTVLALVMRIEAQQRSCPKSTFSAAVSNMAFSALWGR